MSIKAVIFDLDGTLYDNSKLVPELLLCAPFSARMMLSERKMRRELRGCTFGADCYAKMFERLGEIASCTPQRAEEWFFQRFMPAQARALKLFCHAKAWVKPTLEQLRAEGIKLCCFSDYAHVEEKLLALGIEPGSFDLLIDAPAAGGLKPSREAFLYVADRLGVAPGECLVCGDRPDTDGEGAAAAGMAFQLIPRQDMNTLTLNL